MGNAILLIDTSDRTAPDVSAQLARCGFLVHAVRQLETGAHLSRSNPDRLVLLRADDASAVKECRRLSAISSGHIVIVLTKHDEATVVRCLQAGADSVLVAPLSLRELEARVRALLAQRARLQPAPTRRLNGSRFGGLTIDPETRAVTKDGRSLSLTPTEFRLLASLARRAGQTVSHGELISDVWGPSRQDSVDHLRLYVRYLRQKLEDDFRRPSLLLNQRGVGYRLSADTRTSSRRTSNVA